MPDIGLQADRNRRARPDLACRTRDGRVALALLPEAQVWHLGLYRDEETASPVHYYSKLPEGRPVDVAFVLDPMLATGGSALAAIEALREWGVLRISLLSVIASVAGVDRVLNKFPDVGIYAAAVDPELNDRKFIVPGLGDVATGRFALNNDDSHTSEDARLSGLLSLPRARIR